MNLAILSDVADRAESMCRALALAGFQCKHFADSRSFFASPDAGHCDLLIVDAPVGNWAELADKLRRAAGRRVPVLMLADASDRDGIAAALDAGIDDYVVKPLRQAELLTRVQVLLQRAWPEKRASALLRFGQIVFDLMAGAATVDGHPVDLTQREFALAMFLFRHLGQPLSRATLTEAIWPQWTDAPTRTVDTHVSRVRAKLGLGGEGAFRLVPVYGFGYVLETGNTRGPSSKKSS